MIFLIDMIRIRVLFTAVPTRGREKKRVLPSDYDNVRQLADGCG